MREERARRLHCGQGVHKVNGEGTEKTKGPAEAWRGLGVEGPREGVSTRAGWSRRGRGSGWSGRRSGLKLGGQAGGLMPMQLPVPDGLKHSL